MSRNSFFFRRWLETLVGKRLDRVETTSRRFVNISGDEVYTTYMKVNRLLMIM
jgi:hypothetical protein